MLPINQMFSKESGLTLVELMVAAVILGMSISATMSMIGIGRGLEVEAIARREAGSLAASALEDSVFHFLFYDSLSTSPRDSVFYRSLYVDSLSPLADTIIVTVSPEEHVSWSDPPAGALATVSVPFKRITAISKWSLLGKNYSNTLKKRIAKIR